MTVGQAHIDLALSVSDAIFLDMSASPPGITGGARFLKTDRDAALYRAMLAIIQQALMEVNRFPHEVAANMLLRIFPSLTKQMTDTLTTVDNVTIIQFTDPQPVFIYDAVLISGTGLNMTTIPLAVKSGPDSFTLRNDRNIQRYDPFISYFSTNKSLYLHDCYKDLSVGKHARPPRTLAITYLSYPPHPKDSSSTTLLPIEEMYVPKVISLASIYLLSQSGDLIEKDKYLTLDIQNSLAIPLQKPQGG